MVVAVDADLEANAESTLAYARSALETTAAASAVVQILVQGGYLPTVSQGTLLVEL